MDQPDARKLEVEWIVVNRWNRLYPVGTAVSLRLDDGRTHETRTTSIAEVYEGPVAGICVEGLEGAVKLDCCISKIPKEFEPLLENNPAEKVRQKLEHIREGFDVAHTFFALAKHWEYEAENHPEQAEVFLRCAKQLKQRAQWLQEDVSVFKQVIRTAPDQVAKWLK